MELAVEVFWRFKGLLASEVLSFHPEHLVHDRLINAIGYNRLGVFASASFLTPILVLVVSHFADIERIIENILDRAD